MNQLSTAVESLNAKVERLIDLHRTSCKEIDELKLKNVELERQVTEQQTTIDEITDKNKVLSLAKSVAGGGAESLEIKLKINELVREIDKCIALLNK